MSQMNEEGEEMTETKPTTSTLEAALPTLTRITDLEIRLYKLTTKSHLRIGAGEGAISLSAADNPIIRALWYSETLEEKAKRVPYLPASSLHGVIRSWTEKIIKSTTPCLPYDDLKSIFDEVQRTREQAKGELKGMLGDSPSDDQLWEYLQIHPSVCNPILDLDKCERISQEDRERKNWKVQWIGKIGRPVPCEVCKIFGYMGQRGRIRFTHAFPSSENIPVDIIVRVAINRLTGAADEGKLFDVEAIPPGVDFYFFLILENMSVAQKDHLTKAFRAMNLQLAPVGAHSTVGFGMVQVERILTAKLDTQIFNVEIERVSENILTSGEFSPRVPLDIEKYPRFFLALSCQDQAKQPPQGQFDNKISYS